MAFWAEQLGERIAPEFGDDPLASKDIDFQGLKAGLDAVARVLGGRIVLPSTRPRTALVGAAVFVDDLDVERQIDVLREPLGLVACDVVDSAIPIEVDVPDHGPVAISVMHPQRCLESRVANWRLADRRTPLARRQLRAAIACARAFSEVLLDDGERRAVLDLNERTFEMARLDPQAIALARDHGVDFAEALLFDDRLGPHIERRAQQMRRELARLAAVTAS